MAMNTRRRQNLVLKLMAAQYGLCFWCKARCVTAKERPAEVIKAKQEKRKACPEATLDHLWPVGHKNRSKDRVMACRKCNLKRGDPNKDLILEVEILEAIAS